MDFTAIDFETASRSRDSACQLAAVRVRDGKIVHKAMWMIRPDPLYFHPMNIQVHGITPNQVAAEPDFGSLWNAIRETISDDCVVAHNASFDIGVLDACLAKHQLEIPEINYTCTRAVARRTWPGRRGYGLKPLSTWLGVEFKHHDALEDSIACAKLLLAAAIAKEAGSVEELESKLSLSRGKLDQYGYRGPTTIRKRKAKSAKKRTKPEPQVAATNLRDSDPRVDVQRLLIRAEFIRPLSQHSIVFTGRFRMIDREAAEDLARRSGGKLQTSVTKSTNLLVVGSPDERTRASGRTKSVKQETAEQINAQPSDQEIRIVTESEFIGLISSEI